MERGSPAAKPRMHAVRAFRLDTKDLAARRTVALTAEAIPAHRPPAANGNR